MTPDEARDERLSASLDDELSPSDRAALEAALAGDAELRDRLEDLRAVRAALRTLAPVRAPRSFALAAPPARRRGIPRLELATRVATVAVAAAFVVAVVLPGGGGSTTAGPGANGGPAPAPAAANALRAAPAAAPVASATTSAAAGSTAAATPGVRTFAAPAPAPRAAPRAAAPSSAPSTPGGAESGARLAPPAPTTPALPANVAVPQQADRGERRMVTVGLGALAVLLAAMSVGEWIVRKAREP